MTFCGEGGSAQSSLDYIRQTAIVPAATKAILNHRNNDICQLTYTEQNKMVRWEMMAVCINIGLHAMPTEC